MGIEAQALQGLRIVVTRPRDQAAALLAGLRAHGADAIPFPTIAIEPAADMTQLDQALQAIERFDWVVFTSVNGVEIVHQRMQALGVALASLAGSRVAAIGPATARALVAMGVNPELVPDEFVAEAVADGLGAVNKLRILLPRAAGARPVMPERLIQRGAEVQEIAIYRAVPANVDQQGLRQLQAGVDVLTFTSPSTFYNFLVLLNQQQLDPMQLPGDPQIVCIGPITAHAVQQFGMQPRWVAAVYTTDGLIQALIADRLIREAC